VSRVGGVSFEEFAMIMVTEILLNDGEPYLGFSRPLLPRDSGFDGESFNELTTVMVTGIFGWGWLLISVLPA
jgi:hypothetical protein